MADLSLSGLASGFDWKSLVDKLVEVERTPQIRLLNEQNVIQQRNNAYGAIKTQLAVLQNRIEALSDPTLYDSRKVASSETTVGSATASGSAPLGTYQFSVTQLATAARQLGASNIGAPLSATDDVSGLTLADAKFATAVSGGTLTINGKQITIAATDSLQSVFDQINTATNGEVSATYDSNADRITLSSAGTITLGSATDTSNFFTAAKLYNNGTGAVTSSASLGSVSTSAALSSSNLATAISDGGSGTGEFKINGVSISFSASDSLSNVLTRINNSAAGVTATYDTLNDRVVLTNKTTGDVGMALEDVTGNFLVATGVTAGTLERGKNLIYTLNDGDPLISFSNTITESSSGVPGLAFTALKEGETEVTVTSDSEKITTAINDFITEFNKAQSIIDSQTSSTTDSKGKVTAGLLSNENDATEIASRLRSLANGRVTGVSDFIKGLNDLGIISNGNDNSLKLDDEEKLADMLATNLAAVKALFTDETNGVAVKLAAFVEATIGDEGSLVTKQDNLTKDAASIDVQISDLERIVQANKERLTSSFIAMETAQAQMNQQLTFLMQRFGASSGSK
jgi:flagellar hook-associated protein 2